MYYSDINHVSALTIDVEDGINISMRDNFKINMKPTNRVVDNVEIILDICERNNVKATFFILGEVAESYPELVKRIDVNKHEIGIHGFYHDQVFKLSPKMFKNELIKAKELVESITGKKILGFRAPAFSINSQTSWALQIIAECGFKYDSSIVPAKMGRYGWEGFEKKIIKLDLPDNFQLIEAPLSVLNILGHSIPACGGGYLRYFPLGFTYWAFSAIQKHQPVIVYLHPYELDIKKYPEYFTAARRMLSFRKSLPLLLYRFMKSTVKGKLNSILNKYNFVPLKEIIEILERRNAINTIKLSNIAAY